ncbi:MAG: cation:dicarboxylase symporter family transporter [Pseudohongiellaceae bacterium]
MLLAVLALSLFLAISFFLFRLQRRNLTLGQLVLVGLLCGAVFGTLLQLVFPSQSAGLDLVLEWISVVGGAYVSLLRMLVIPLVLVTMIAAVLRLDDAAALGRIGVLIISLLVGTTMVAALIGVGVTLAFDLSADGLVAGAVEMERLQVLETRLAEVSDLSLPQLLVSFIPTNIFYDLTGARSNSIIAVVVFGILFGLASLFVVRDNPETGKSIRNGVDAAQAVVMQLVRMIMALTPYGILALMTTVVARSSAADILSLLNFVIASYVAIAVMFAVHALILKTGGVNLADYARKVWPVLSFAFVTRSSAATIPLSIKTQIDELQVPVPVANMAASFGATIGQNGCAGIYPAMLAVMVAPTMGINPLDPGFIVSLIGIVGISSFGIAGVGGGATYAALVVLPALGMPVTLVALLISIEPLIDMARTALNVNGSITAGMVTTRVLRH